METIDEKIQNKLALDAMFQSGGWLLFKERLNELFESNRYNIDKLTAGMVENESLQKFNFYLGEKKALQTVLGIKDELYEEFEESENSPVSA